MNTPAFRARLRFALNTFASALPAAALLLLAGCGSEQPPITPANASSPSKVVIKGSNTIGEELAPRLIAEFKKDHPSAVFELESKGTGYGLAALMAGQCDLAAASRAPIKDEADLAKSRNLELNEHAIGFYSVAVVVPAGTAVKNLTRDQVRDIFTGKITNWKDVGGADTAIKLCIRDPISGTYLGFKELAMENQPYASGTKTFTNYAAIVQAVAADPAAIGYASFDQIANPGVVAIQIAGVPATAEAVRGGKYPFARMLRFYTSKAGETEMVAEFLKFTGSKRGQDIIAQTGDITRP